MSFYIKGGAASAHKSKLTNQLFIRVNGAQSEKLLLPPLQVLRGFFNEHGKVVKIISVKEGTIAFVTFESPTEALAAKEAMNGREIVINKNGENKVCSIFVDFTREKPKEFPRQFISIVYLFPDQRPKMMSNQAMALLFDLGLSPKSKFQGDTNVQIFGNGIHWVIPHPDHPYATQDCQRAYESGHYFTQFPIKIPREVLTSKKFWRD